MKPKLRLLSLIAVSPRGDGEPELLWSYPYPDLGLQAVSADGRYAWIGVDLVDLEEGELVHVRERNSLDSFAFSPDGEWWLYTYQTVSREGGTHVVYRLAVRPAGTPEEEEQVLLEGKRGAIILGWSHANLVGILLVSREDPAVELLRLVPVER